MTRLEKKLNAQLDSELKINDVRLRKGDDFVLRAVRCHDELVGALKMQLEYLSELNKPDGNEKILIATIEQVLAKAEVKKCGS